MDIKKHYIWNNINPLKKPVHLFRFSLARNYAKFYPRSAFIGITGSVGKTTTAQACMAVLSEKFKTLATKSNLDPIFNIPITLLALRPKVKKVILEMGITHPGEMDFYLSLIHPATAIVTRIFYAHSEYLGDVEQIIKEKSILLKQLPKNGFAILNWDDFYTRGMAQTTEAQVIFYGTDPKKCLVWADKVQIEGKGIYFELNYGVERVEVRLKLLGKHFIYPALAAAALGISSGMSLTAVKKGLEKIEAPEHRLKLLAGPNGATLLDDTYNSSPAALEEALNVLNELPARRRIAVLGEMRELGVYSEEMHRRIAQKIYKDKVDFVFLGGGDTRFLGDELIRLGFLPERLEINLSNSQLVSKILKVVGRGDVVLVKGSRSVRLDEVVKRVTKV